MTKDDAPDSLDRLLSEFFREEVARTPGVDPPPKADGPRKTATASRGEPRVTSDGPRRIVSAFGRFALAAAAAACIVLPHAGVQFFSPAAQAFTKAHVRLESGARIVTGLTSAHEYLRVHFAGGTNDE